MKAAHSSHITLLAFHVPVVPIVAKYAFCPVCGLFGGIFDPCHIPFQVKIILLSHRPGDTADIDIRLYISAVDGVSRLPVDSGEDRCIGDILQIGILAEEVGIQRIINHRAEHTDDAGKLTVHSFEITNHLRRGVL